MRRIVVTGSSGLLGWHAHARLHAGNCAARFQDASEPYDIVALDQASFSDDATLEAALASADAVLHFAGVNRAPDEELEAANPAIAERHVAGCRAVDAAPHIVYANSTHCASETPYGRSKRRAGEILAKAASRFTDIVLPHIFGEGAQPFYNNVTATLIHQILSGEAPTVNPEGQVRLLHAGSAAQAAIEAALEGVTGVVVPEPRPMTVPALLETLQRFHGSYTANVFPDLSDSFELALFNSYRAATYPTHWPRPLALNTDARGTLFEAVKGGGGGQTFLSTTRPGVTRGDHFHLNKVERFLVIPVKP